MTDVKRAVIISVTRIVVMFHGGQLSQGKFVLVVYTDVNDTNEEIDEEIKRHKSAGAILVYDGPPNCNLV